MYAVIRSYREFRRVVQFGTMPGDIVFRWLHEINDCRVLYDVGSANGLEGFLANCLHGSHVVFIEPFTPSIETILKTIWVTGQNGGDVGRFDVVHAGCDERESYDRMYVHTTPKPGETMNTFAHPEAYARGGRKGHRVAVSQWLKGVSLDSLHYVYGLPAPTHIKIDVDGFENRVVRGAARLLRERVAQSWMIEITGNANLAEIEPVMAQSGYEEFGRWEHYPGYEPRTFDIGYRRSDLA
jgi:FkbM family methyltransferase